jgi:hypothetical protein
MFAFGRIGDAPCERKPKDDRILVGLALAMALQGCAVRRGTDKPQISPAVGETKGEIFAAPAGRRKAEDGQTSTVYRKV